MTVAFSLSATASNPTTSSGGGIGITNPGVSAGELMIVQCTLGGNGTGVTPPTGWSTLDGDRYNSPGNANRSIFYKIATGSEPGTFTFVGNGIPGTTRMNGGLVTYTGVDQTTPIDTWGWTFTDLNTGQIGPLPALTTSWGLGLSAGDTSGFRAFTANTSSAWITTGVVLKPAGFEDTLEVALAAVFNIRSFTPPTSYTERLDFGDYSQTIADGLVTPGPAAPGGWSVGKVRIA